MKSNITILICLFVLTISCANKTEPTWDQIANSNWNKSYYISSKEVKNREQFIVFLRTGISKDNYESKEVKDVLKSLEKKVLFEEFDPILTLLYFSENNRKDKIISNTNLLTSFLRFNNEENNNSLGSYLLSYYYALNSDHDKCIQYLKEGNSRSEFNYYSDEIRKIIFEYYINKTGNEIFSYWTSILSGPSHAEFLGMYFRSITSNKKYIGKYKDKLNILVHKEDIYKLEINLQKSNFYIVDENISRRTLLEGLDNNLNREMYQKIDNYYSERSKNKQIDIGSELGEDKFLEFLKNWYSYGEIYAFGELNNSK